MEYQIASNNKCHKCGLPITSKNKSELNLTIFKNKGYSQNLHLFCFICFFFYLSEDRLTSLLSLSLSFALKFALILFFSYFLSKEHIPVFFSLCGVAHFP